MSNERSRRTFLRTSAAALATPALWAQAQKAGPPQELEEIGPVEDLMREHGVLNRILLIYEEAERRLRGNRELDPRVLGQAAEIVQRFIEQYHEKLEEDHLFPRFEKAKKLGDLVATLRQQHAAGRTLTDQILALTRAGSLRPVTQRDQPQRQQLLDALQRFVRMYRPHEAREDTVLFPALHEIVGPQEYAALGEDFERKEHELFGAEGFEGVRDQVAGLEKQLGIYDLAQFTPKQ